MSDKKKPKPFRLQEFLFDTPIYKIVSTCGDDQSEREIDSITYPLTDNEFDHEGYNIAKRKDSTFRVSRKLSDYNNNTFESSGFGEIHLECKRYGTKYRYYCHFSPDQEQIVKVGQYPSLATVQIGEVKQYNKVLPVEKMKEFTKGIGLAANGVGIGSYVYLRRIFEYLIGEAKDRAIKDSKITESDFQKVRMDDRIGLLNNYLPDFLVKHKKIYSVLSKGIHELDEDTCLGLFDTLKVGIEIILDQELAEKIKNDKESEASKKIQALSIKTKPNKK